MEVQIPLVLFTLFLCLTSGLMGFQGYLLVAGKGSNKFHRVTMIATVVSLAIGGIAVFTHLHHWERIFNGFGHLTSGITHELILVVAMIIALVVAFIFAHKGRAEGKVPGKVFGIIFIILALVGGFVTAHSYDMYARPAWNNIFLYLYYYSSLLILGAAGIWSIAAILKEGDVINGTFAKITLVTTVIAAIVCIVSMWYIQGIEPTTIDGITFYTYDPCHPAADPAGDLACAWSGDYALCFWGGAVALGCILPLIVSLLAVIKKNLAVKPVIPVVTLVLALAGGVFYRIALYAVAIASYVYFF